MLKNLFERHRYFFIKTLFMVVVIFLLAFLSKRDNRQSERQALLWRVKNSNRPPVGDDAFTAYYKMNDSLERVTNWKLNKLIGTHSRTAIITTAMEEGEYDTYAQYNGDVEGIPKTTYYYDIPGIRLNEDASFSIDSGKYHLHTTVWDKVNENSKEGHGVTREIPVRYSADVRDGREMDSSLMIPIKKKTHSILAAIGTICSFLVAVFLLRVFLILPLKTLFRISTGNSFVRENIVNLYWIGWTQLAWAFYPAIRTGIAMLIFRKQIPPEFEFPFFQVISNEQSLIIGGVITLLLAYAFKEGNKLQTYEDQTI